jgi:hypothetical protein
MGEDFGKGTPSTNVCEEEPARLIIYLNTHMPGIGHQCGHRFLFK